MILHYHLHALTGPVLLRRPATQVPREGDLVTLQPSVGGAAQTYCVTAVRDWRYLLPPDGIEYYSQTDAHEEHVHVVLIEEVQE